MPTITSTLNRESTARYAPESLKAPPSAVVSVTRAGPVATTPELELEALGCEVPLTTTSTVSGFVVVLDVLELVLLDVLELLVLVCDEELELELLDVLELVLLHATVT